MLESTTVLIHAEELAQLEAALGPKHPVVCRARECFEGETPDIIKYREAASRQHREGELEVDAGAAVSVSEDHGAYVSVWLWIDDEEAGVTREEEAA
jgi:hypothetical protein